MTETPESKALRALVTAIKKGQKPDVTAAEAALGRQIPEAYVSKCDALLVNGITKRANAAHNAIRKLPGNAQTLRRYRILLRDAHSAFETAFGPPCKRKNDLISDARAGKLTKKQFDKAVKDFFK